jgi:hypothetical protein
MTVRRICVLVALLLIFSPSSSAHLCNHVFRQAQDNLAVKVDIRDGQLRIDEEANFRVYLLNTMDRDIANINLAIQSQEFDAEVTASDGWSTFPRLKTMSNGGKKEYFEVKLLRKEGVEDGEYEIKLKLYSGKNQSKVFKRVDLGSVVSVTDVPEAEEVSLDGSVVREEWGQSVLVTDLHWYLRDRQGYRYNKKADDQPRFRFQADEETLFVAVSFQGGDDAEKDTGVVHLARDVDDEPVSIALDRTNQEVRVYRGRERQDDVDIRVAFDEDDKTVECAIPLSLLDLEEDQSTFLMNASRQMTTDGVSSTSYWRGNGRSRLSPVVYEEFALVSLSSGEGSD